MKFEPHQTLVCHKIKDVKFGDVVVISSESLSDEQDEKIVHLI